MADPVFTLTPDQHAHLEVMRAIADGLVDTPLVLKGGSALVFAYGLDRFSTDLDFDSTKKLNLENRIRSVLSSAVQVIALERTKDTDTVTRYRLSYRLSTGIAGKLKIEISYRDAQVPEQIKVINGVRTYSAGRLIEQKLAASNGRTAPRDLYDLAFLAGKYPKAFDADAARILHELTDDADALEARYRPAFERDKSLLQSQHDSLESVIVRLLDARAAVDKATRSASADLLWPESETESHGEGITLG